jgi:hypothetical protein
MLKTTQPSPQLTNPTRTETPSPATSAWRVDVLVGVFLLLWIALLIVGQSKFFQDPGTFWHTVVGEQMLSTGTLVVRDTFTFTEYHEPWLAHQWLGELTLAGLYRLGGFDAQLLASVTLLAGLFTLLVARMRRQGFNWMAAASVIAVVIGVCACHLHVRPHLATMLGIAVTYIILCDVESGRASFQRLWWLVPLSILWTNIHGGALGGVASIGLVFGGWLVAYWLQRPTPLKSRYDVWWLVAIGGCCVGATLVNPWGWRLPAAWGYIMQMPLKELIQEQAPLSFRDSTGLMTLLCAVGYMVVLTGLFKSGVSLRVAWLLPLVWFMLAIDRVRNAPLFAILVAIAICEVLPLTRWHGRLRTKGWLLPKREVSLAPIKQLWSWSIGVAIAVAISAIVLRWGWARLDPKIWPLELLPELTAMADRPEPQNRIFNTVHDGGFLILFCPHLKVFIDDRCELFGNLLPAYCEAERRHPEQIDSWRQQYGFSDALVENHTPFDRYLSSSPKWQLVQRSFGSALYRSTAGE